MKTFMIISLVSIALSSAIIILSNKKKLFLNVHDNVGVQKFHHQPVPHVGGVAVFFGFFIGILLLTKDVQDLLLPLFLIASPVFLVGLAEDWSAKIPPSVRMLFILIAVIISFSYLGIGIFSLGFWWTDYLLSYQAFALAFTLLVVGGAVNALNVIDGFNGLMPGYTLLVLLALGFVAYQLDDILILQTSLLFAAAIFGFFVLNFPFGKLFIGDGGAYFIGFMLSMIGLVFVSRHEVLSNWFVLALLMYPMYELLFSIFRKRIVNGTHASKPDGYHLHMLIYKTIASQHPNRSKVINNSMTSPFLWLLSLVSILPAIIWFNNQYILIAISCVFMVIYSMIYRWIANKKI